MEETPSFLTFHGSNAVDAFPGHRIGLWIHSTFLIHSPVWEGYNSYPHTVHATRVTAPDPDADLKWMFVVFMGVGSLECGGMLSLTCDLLRVLIVVWARLMNFSEN